MIVKTYKFGISVKDLVLVHLFHAFYIEYTVSFFPKSFTVGSVYSARVSLIKLKLYVYRAPLF